MWKVPSLILMTLRVLEVFFQDKTTPTLKLIADIALKTVKDEKKLLNKLWFSMNSNNIGIRKKHLTEK